MLISCDFSSAAKSFLCCFKQIRTYLTIKTERISVLFIAHTDGSINTLTVCMLYMAAVKFLCHALISAGDTKIRCKFKKLYSI